MADRDHFDKWAGSYDESVRKDASDFPFDGYYDLLEAVRREIEVSAGQRILDIGVGTGLLSSELYKSGCEVFGIDFSAGMIAKARERMPQAEFIIADVAADGIGDFSSSTFDRIISTYCLHHLTDARKAELIPSLVRMNLRPGGKVIIGDIGFADREAFEAAYRDLRDHWDEEEFYLCGEEIVSTLRESGLAASYRQVSSCAGLLTVTKLGD